MKKLLLLSVTAAIVATVTGAGAAELKQYVSLKGNYAFMKASFKDSEDGEKTKLNDKTIGASLAYGVKMGDIRTELEANISQNADKKWAEDGEKASTQANSLFLNAYYDIPASKTVKPYLGAGLGLARVKTTFKWEADPLDPTDTGKWSMSKNKFAYQIGAGVGYELSQNWTLDAGYRYMDFGTASKKDEDGKNKLSVKTHNFYLGARYSF